MGKLSHLKKAIEGAKRRVYQGSPHKYDGKLDPSKIGTGEGAQAYGYGHYLAENPDVAKGYQDRLSDGMLETPDGEVFDVSDLEHLNVRARLRKNKGDVQKTLDSLVGVADDAPVETQAMLARDIAKLEQYKASGLKSGGHLYEFDLPESAIDNMLDWDAPVSEQPAIMDLLQDRTDSPEYDGIGMDGVIEDVFNEDMINEFGMLTGSDFYDKLLYQANEDGADASAFAKNLGITGIKYHDGMSRAAGEGTRNFVIFPGNEDIVKAVSRNGEKLSAAALAPLAGIGLMGTFSEDSQAGVGGTIKAAGKALDMSEAARMQRAKDMGFEGGYYKGMYPYDWTKEAGNYPGPEITEINRATPFPSFGGSDGDVDIAGFLTKDVDVANRFAGVHNGAVYPLMYKKGRELVIDAGGRRAGDVQFGEAGRPFREASRSGKYDTITITNTADEGDITVALDPKNIRSVNAAFDPAKKDSADLLASLGGAGVLGAAALRPEDARAAELEAIALHGEPERKWRPTEKRNKWKVMKSGLYENLVAPALEGMAAVNRGAVDTVNFVGPDQVNAILQLSGSEKRVPTLNNIPGIDEATAGNYMQKGLPRDIVRTGGEFLSPL